MIDTMDLVGNNQKTILYKKFKNGKYIPVVEIGGRKIILLDSSEKLSKEYYIHKRVFTRKEYQLYESGKYLNELIDKYKEAMG